MASNRSHSDDEDEELLSTDPESRDAKNPKRLMCKVKWSRDEDELLKKLIEKHGTDAWKLIASYLPKRTDGQCQHRWQKVLNPELVKGPWTKEEDQRVIELVHKYGPKSWSVIAKHLQGRIGKQCRERWHNHLNPAVKKSSWTEEEDRIIYQAHRRLGNRWAEISKLLPGRTDNSIKNHWNSTMRRKVEHEGYLQESSGAYKSVQAMKRAHKSRSSADMRHEQNQMFLTSPAQLSEYSFGPLDRQCVDGIPESSPVYVQQPCHDDPEKEQRIKELELLLMSAENEVRRQAASCNPDRYTRWSDSVADDSMTTMSSLEDRSMEFCRAEESLGPASTSARGHVSPSRFLAVEASAVLNSLQTIPEFAETMELLDSDPVAWGDVASFSLAEVASPVKRQEAAPFPQPQGRDGTPEEVGYRFDGLAVTDQAKGCGGGGPGGGSGQGKDVPFVSPIAAKFGTPPSILRRKRRERGEQSPSGDSASFMDTSASSPKTTPVKALPFSPSQFFNISGNEHLNLDNPALTSTPVCRQKCLLNTPQHKEMTPKHQKENAGFRTPKIRKSIMGHTPRTPTPFKNAMAAQEKMYGPLKMVPQPLAFLEEDIREVLKEETGTDIFHRGDMQPEFRAWKHEADAPARKVRKSLVLDSWGKDCLNVQLFSQEQLNNAQPPADSLLTCSLLTTPALDREGAAPSPSQAKQEAGLSPRGGGKDRDSPSLVRTSRYDSPAQVDSEWETVVYGKTEDQLIMTEQARKYLNTYSTGCASRALVL